MALIRRCNDTDFDAIRIIINDAARAYEGVIPMDRWKEPYMSKDELEQEIRDGVIFWGYVEGEQLVGVMGIQDVKEVSLIRHRVRSYNETEPRDRWKITIPPSLPDHPSSPGRYVGRCHMGDSILRKTWLSTGQQGNERSTAERILVDTDTTN